MHFAFDLTATQALMYASSRQTEEDLLDLTFFEIEEEMLRAHPIQHCYWDPRKADLQLAFLPTDVAQAAQATLPQPVTP